MLKHVGKPTHIDQLSNRRCPTPDRCDGVATANFLSSVRLTNLATSSTVCQAALYPRLDGNQRHQMLHWLDG
jgi:hypothetical protein